MMELMRMLSWSHLDILLLTALKSLVTSMSLSNLCAQCTFTLGATSTLQALAWQYWARTKIVIVEDFFNAFDHLRRQLIAFWYVTTHRHARFHAKFAFATGPTMFFYVRIHWLNVHLLNSWKMDQMWIESCFRCSMYNLF